MAPLLACEHILIHIFLSPNSRHESTFKVPPLACKGRGTALSAVEGFLRGITAKWLRKGSGLAENPSDRASRSPSLDKGRSFLVIKFQCSDLCIRICSKGGGTPPLQAREEFPIKPHEFTESYP